MGKNFHHTQNLSKFNSNDCSVTSLENDAIKYFKTITVVWSCVFYGAMALMPYLYQWGGKTSFTYNHANLLSAKLKKSIEQYTPKVLRQNDNLGTVTTITKPSQKLTVVKLKGNWLHPY